MLNGQLIKHFRSDKVLALLIYLIVEAAQVHPRGKLAGLLWPDQPERMARHNLSQTLLRLRTVLQDSPADSNFVTTTRQVLQFNRHSQYQLDVQAFEMALVEAEAASNDEHRRIHHLRQAVELYRGDFLPHFYLEDSDLFEEWAITKRAYLRQEVFSTLETLIAYYDAGANMNRGSIMLAAWWS